MKELKQLGKNAMILTATGVGLGIGASMISDAGGDTSAIKAVSRGLPILGSLAVGSAVIGSLSELNKSMSKRRY